MQTFFWHDYETFGADSRRDRPVQFAGIRTTPERAALIRDVQAGVAPWGKESTILVAYDFPGGYLLSAATPAADTVWTGLGTTDGLWRKTTDYLRARETTPTLILLAYPYGSAPGDPVRGYAVSVARSRHDLGHGLTLFVTAPTG